MARPLDPGAKRALADRLSYYRELGIYDFYRREPLESDSAGDGASFGLDENPDSQICYQQSQTPLAILQSIREDLGECTRCKLHKQGRKQIVFGVGNPHADLMFVGEGPGADEDEQGEPFVGRAGQLLNNMIAAMGVKREEVYIANVVKCRPPGNRTPEPDECATCSPFLIRQIDAIQPKALVALGAVAARTLTGLNEPMMKMRGKWFDFRGVPLAVTYHPAYLLRDPRQKVEAWKDLQMVMKALGLKALKKAE
jgi:uracil-DNA glycosylase